MKFSIRYDSLNYDIRNKYLNWYRYINYDKWELSRGGWLLNFNTLLRS